MKPLLAALTLLACAGAHAQNYPTKTIRIVVPFAPGGNVDINARAVAPGLTELLGQPVVVDNRAGAGGMIGGEIVAKAPPDGYTLMMMSASFSASSALHQPSWDPIKNIIPVAEFGTTPFVLVVHPSVKANTAKELIALAASKPNGQTYASTGTGGITHLATELMMNMTKIQMVHVPYKSTGAAMIDVLSGQAPIMVGSLLPVTPHIQGGRLRGLAVTTAKRWYSLPDVPPLGDTIPGYNVELWFGTMVPIGTPPAIIRQLNGVINKALESAEIKKNLEKDGMVPTGGTPEKFGERITKDYNNWLKVVKSANIKTSN